MKLYYLFQLTLSIMRDCCADGMCYISFSQVCTQRGQDTVMGRMYRKHFPEESKIIPFKEFKEMYLLLSNGKLVDDRCAHILTVPLTDNCTLSSHRPTGSFIPNYTRHMWITVHKSIDKYPRKVIDCIMDRKKYKQVRKMITHSGTGGGMYQQFRRVPTDLIDIILSYTHL